MMLLASAMTGIPVPSSFDCAMRKAAYAYGQKLLPRKGAFEELYYALNLNDPDCLLALKQGEPVFERPAVHPAWLTNAVFVSPNGDDRGSGSHDAPVGTLQLAVDKAASSSPPRAVVLRGGTHYVERAIVLEARHSGIRIATYPGEKAVVSGGKRFAVEWKPYQLSKAKWVEATEQNAVYGATIDNRTVVALGRLSDAVACRAACMADKRGCKVFTWHDASQGTKYTY